MVNPKVKQFTKDVFYGSVMLYRIPTVIRHEEQSNKVPLGDRHILEAASIALITGASWYIQYRLLEGLEEYSHMTLRFTLGTTNILSGLYEGLMEIKSKHNSNNKNNLENELEK